MNDIAKNAASDRFLKALEKESLKKAAAGACLGISAEQVSYLFNLKYWNRLGTAGWDKILKWANSGQGLKEYSEKHGRVLPEKKHIELPPKIISVKPIKALSNYKPEKRDEIKAGPEIISGKLLTAPSFMESFIEALKQIPSNVTIQISINDNK